MRNHGNQSNQSILSTELCWNCKQQKQGVTLCAEDRLCPECNEQNVKALAALRQAQTGTASGSTAVEGKQTRGRRAGPNAAANSRSDELLSPRASDTHTPSLKEKAPTKVANKMSQRKTTAKSSTSDVATSADPVTEFTEIANDQDLTPQPAPASCACHDELEKLCLKTDTLQSAQTDSVEQLRVIIHQQELIIQTMQQQLNFVLSYLNISATDNNPCIQLSTNQSGEKSTINQIAPQSQPPMKQTRRLVNDFRQSVATAVYIDQSERQRRQSNVVVSGLQPSQTVSDAELFKNLCFSEFGIQPDIVKLKRLGSHHTKKVQPILVNMRQNAQAQLLISSAKQLRQSSDAAVRDHVYINPDLTRAEAEAAYQLRLQRRRRRPADQGHGPAVTSAEISEQSIDPGASTVLSPPAITVPDSGPSTGRHGE